MIASHRRIARRRRRCGDDRRRLGRTGLWRSLAPVDCELNQIEQHFEWHELRSRFCAENGEFTSYSGIWDGPSTVGCLCLPGASFHILKCHVVTTKFTERLFQFPYNSWQLGI